MRNLLFFILSATLLMIGCSDSTVARAPEALTSRPDTVAPLLEEPTAAPPVPTGVPHAPTATPDLATRRSDELAAARLRWTAAGPENYSFQVTESCACDGWILDTVVLDGSDRFRTVVQASDDRAQLQSDVARWPDTVDALFERAEEILAAMAVSQDNRDCEPAARITFDEETGVPLLLSDETDCGGHTWTVDFQLVNREGDPVLVEWDEFAAHRGFTDATISFAPGIDGIMFVFRTGFGGGEGYDEIEQLEIGSPCADEATNVVCLESIAALVDDPETPILLEYPCENCASTEVIMIVTESDGGEPVVVSTAEQALEIVGPIDSAEEAMLVVGRGGAAKQRPDGQWTVVTSEYIAACDPIIERQQQSILALDGSLTEIDRWYTISWGVCI